MADNPMQATHDRFAAAMDEALRVIRKAEVLRARATFVYNRPPADAYVLAAYKAGTK